ncbi:MAG: hypothetical protein J4478_05095 [Candidatus Diapherotrites archaeon]|uniref:Uncharacterized protein n=1 Tax=Candidatus Iainarchaeum sp. TaxID=3101447 RepID=A0A7J4KW64_9ARCH|nr:hypothetical protein [Candidatus Diapherotrites archaeon]HIH33359.1 hypothetical protein [Candidatus Diapherotrites archaeon]
MIKQKESSPGRPFGRRFMFLTPEAEARERLANSRIGASLVIRGQTFVRTLVGVRRVGRPLMNEIK